MIFSRIPKRIQINKIVRFFASEVPQERSILQLEEASKYCQNLIKYP